MSSPLVATTESRRFNVWDGASGSSTVALAAQSNFNCLGNLDVTKWGFMCMHNCQIHLAAIQQTFSSDICIVETERPFELHWTDLMFTKRLRAQHVQCINSWLYLSDNGIRSTRKRSLFRGAQCPSSMVVRASRDIFAAHEGSCGEFDTDEIVFVLRTQRLQQCNLSYMQITDAAKTLVDTLHKSKEFTDTANFALRCGVCNKGLKGEKEAVEHAKQTSHQNFQEY
jgi:hypothetical protein